MTSGYTVVDLSAVDLEPSTKSGTPTAYLTELLGTTEVAVTLRRLPPGGTMPYHHQDRQEELYLLLDGEGSMVIDDERVDVEPPAVVRVAPETPRQLFNDGDRDATWFVFGAPPGEDDGTVIGPGPAADIV